MKKNFDEKKTIKNVKLTKRSHPYEGYASACIVHVLNSFMSSSSKMLNLQLKIN